MRRWLAGVLFAGGALALSACGPVAYDTGYGYGYPDYEAPYYSGGYYGGTYGFYGSPYYGTGVVIGGGHGFHDHHDHHHERHEAYEHGRPPVAAPNVAARPLPPVAHPAAPMNRAPTVAPAPPMTRPVAPNRAMMAPPPGRHHF